MIATKNLVFKKWQLYLAVFFLSITINAQKTEKFYNFQWKECNANEAQYYAITQKVDSGYSRKNYFIKQQKLLYSINCKDSICKIKNGEFISLYPNGKIESKGMYIDNKREGTWFNFYHNGKMKDSVVYSNGNPIGIILSWYPNGFQRDSVYSSVEKSGAKVSWFDNGTPSSYGTFAAGQKKTGKWKYFHKNGKISAIETYQDLKLIDVKYFDEKGEPLNSTDIKDTPAKFPGDEKKWARNIMEYIMSYFPQGFKLINTHKVSVVANFTINEEGKIENVYLSVPFDDNLDHIIIKVIQNSPEWIPATNHNRKVKQDRRIPISFSDQKPN